MIRCLLTLLLLSVPVLAQAMTALFYQPQTRDRAVPEAQWPGVFASVREQGFDTLVVQWTRYGDAFADPAGEAWLRSRVQEARAQGLQVVLGLAADPEFFQRQQQSGPALRHYLRRQAQRNLQSAQAWSKALGPEAIAAWYLPLEIDDRRWRDAGARELLYVHLAEQRAGLSRIAPRTVYVSSFFAGNMTPQRYRDLLSGAADSGVRVWVQDGAGTGRLFQGERRLYLDALDDCAATPAAGVVHELFRQVAVDTAFRAEPPEPAEAGRILAQRASCGGGSVFFELRYLPAVSGILPH